METKRYFFVTYLAVTSSGEVNGYTNITLKGLLNEEKLLSLGIIKENGWLKQN